MYVTGIEQNCCVSMTRLPAVNWDDLDQTELSCNTLRYNSFMSHCMMTGRAPAARFVLLVIDEFIIGVLMTDGSAYRDT